MSSQGQVNPAGPGNGQNLDSGPTSRIDVPPNQLSHRNNAKISSPATPSGRSGPSTRVSQRENASETSSSDNGKLISNSIDVVFNLVKKFSNFSSL